MASLITKRFSVLPSLTKYFLQKSSSKSLSSTSFLLQQAKVQHPAPEFKGQAVVDGQFKEVSLSDFKGKWLVLFFYPLDFTFVRNPTLFLYISFIQITVLQPVCNDKKLHLKLMYLLECKYLQKTDQSLAQLLIKNRLNNDSQLFFMIVRIYCVGFIN